MTRSILAAVLALGLPIPAAAQGVFVPPPGSVVARDAQSGLRAHVARELRYYGLGGVDVGALTPGQVAHVNAILHSGRSQGDIRALVRSAVRGGFLQGALDRVTGR